MNPNMTKRFCPVFLTSHADDRRTMIMYKPRTIAKNSVCNSVKLNPFITMFAKAPNQHVGRVVKT